jgi:putative ATP-dependent endonuclease of the OLD family
MKLVRLRLSNFQSFGDNLTELELGDMTYLLGPNGTGKTAVLQALARMFSHDPGQRRVKRSDFHVPVDEAPEDTPEERELLIEAYFEFPELVEDCADEDNLPAVPGNFAHMQLVSEDSPPQVRFRLKAIIDQDNDIEETFTYVTREDEYGNPLEESRVSKQDRNAIRVHYLPARRDPADHISYSANALLGRALRSVDWTSEREQITTLTGQISEALTDNQAIEGITTAIANQWSDLHKGVYYTKPAVSFARDDIENLLRHLGICFTPGHGETLVDFSRLSDGQQSALYISLVLAMHDIGSRVLNGELTTAFDIDKLRPPVFTLIAIEEPENSLSPHYLGRVVKTITSFSRGRDAQALMATHSPSLLRRVPPESVRFLRLDGNRTTLVKHIELPKGTSVQKFVREGVQAFPELYFSRLVVLGEGDSEEIVLPRLLADRGILTDDASISVVPLGGRHVNHFWRLLHELGIPHVTLLDLDVARYQGGWGRIKYAAKQLLKYADVSENDLTQVEVDKIPKWDDDQGVLINDDGWISRLEKYGIFFSTPLDLDFMMITNYPKAYNIKDDELEKPDDRTVKAVLGKNHDILEGQYNENEQAYFDAYHKRFKLGSKPTWHIRAMARMDDDTFLENIPKVIDRMFDRVESNLKDLPE